MAINEIDVKPNSHKYKQENSDVDTRKRPEKVVTGVVKTRKKSELSKFTDVFIAEDAKSVGSYLITDVLVPNLINLAEDLVIKGIRKLLRGESGSSSRNTSASYVSYRNYSDNRDGRGSEPRTRTGYNYDDIVLASRGEAEEVLDRMQELIDTYDMVSVADMYDLVGKTCAYTDNKYGWTNIRNAEPVRVRDGYMLKLPKVGPLNMK